MNTKRLLLFACLALLLSGCSFVNIVNLSELTLRVQVITPDSGQAYTHMVRPANSVDVFSSHGGRYVVTALPDEAYKKLLEQLQAEISKKLFEDRGTLTGNDVARLVRQLNAIDEQLELVAKQGATCAGNLPDYETVVVTAAWNNEVSNWQLSCP